MWFVWKWSYTKKRRYSETVKERLDVYQRETQPLIEFYSEKQLLSEVNGTKAIIEVFRGICEILGKSK